MGPPVLIILLLTILPCLLQAAQIPHTTSIGERECGPTPETLKRDFITSCGLTGYNPEFCYLAWDKFTKAFSGRDPATVTESDYDEYFELLTVKEHPNQSLFWSGTFAIAQVLSRDNVEIRVASAINNTVSFFHLLGDENLGLTVTSTTNTDSSAILIHVGEEMDSDLYWCGKSNEGIDYEAKSCDCTPVDAFKSKLSKAFARAANGVAFFLTNGQRKEGAYSASSQFATLELPNMTPGAVKRVAILVVHEEGEGESCRSPHKDSLALLHSTLEKQYGYGYDCYDLYGDPTDPKQTLRIAEQATGYIRKVQYDGSKHKVLTLRQELYLFAKDVIKSPYNRL